MEYMRKLHSSTQENIASFYREFATLRPKQRIIFDPTYRQCTVFAGRGYGKTRMLAEWVHGKLTFHKNVRGLLISRYLSDGRRILVDDPNVGLTRMSSTAHFRRQESQLIYPHNNSVVTIVGSQDINKVRGTNSDFIAIDEAAFMEGGIELYEDLHRTLRGKMCGKPQMLCVSTPLYDPLSIRIKEDSDLFINGASMENTELPPQYLQRMKETLPPDRYEMEVLGKIPDTVPSAMFPMNLFENRISDYDTKTSGDSVCVSVDPSLTSGETGSNTGCVVVAKRGEECHVITAREWRQNVTQWSKWVVELALEYGADSILVEVQGGEGAFLSVKEEAKKEGYPVNKMVRQKATKSKLARAERASYLFGEGKLLLGRGRAPGEKDDGSDKEAMTTLRSQMQMMSRDETMVGLDKRKREDILDALAHAVHWLSPPPQDAARIHTV